MDEDSEFKVYDLKRLLSILDKRSGRSNIVDLIFERKRRALERENARQRPLAGPEGRNGPVSER